MKAFFQGLAAAALGGAVTAGAHAYASGTPDLKTTGAVALAGAVSTVIAYLLQSPIGQKVSSLLASAQTASKS